MLDLKSPHPFCDGRFHSLLEAAGLLNEQSGWTPHCIESDTGALPFYIKGHSYGEYIFDWAWAEFYERHGVNYYPKMIHALPFTPINAPKVLGSGVAELIEKAKEFYLSHDELSSHHFLFTNEEENIVLEKLGYLRKETLQYHFKNHYSSFEDFLSHLKTRKRKNIKKERAAVLKAEIKIEWKTGSELDEDLMNQVYKLYLSTISKKQSYAYLNHAFFEKLPEFLEDDLKIALAFKDENLIAMSLFVAGKECLYGRYWGIDPKAEAEFPFLHFELCYYQGMEYCFDKKIPLFEAGAQGEHKLLRGFEPVVITSYHHLRNKAFHSAIQTHLVEHNEHNQQTIDALKQHLPFKSI